MNCEEIDGKCRFCGKMIKIRNYDDPRHRIYDCSDCGKYILLEEIYNYVFFPTMDFSIYSNKLKPIKEKFMIRNSIIFPEDVIFVIGNNEYIGAFQNSGIVLKQHEGILWQYLSYADLITNEKL